MNPPRWHIVHSVSSALALPRAARLSSTLKFPGLSLCAAKYAERSSMSSRLRGATNGSIVGSLRRPSLKSLICRYRYRAVCPARIGNCGTAEFPPGPWHAAQVSAFFRPASTSCACAPPGTTRASTRKRAARRRPPGFTGTRSVEREHEQAVAALEVKLRVAAATHRDVLLRPDHVGHRHRICARATIETPKLLSALGV